MPALLKSPKGTGAPAITGGSQTPASPVLLAGRVGRRRGRRAPVPLPAELRATSGPANGAAAGNSASLTASSPGAYRCTVTATNHAGSTAQTSAPFGVSPAAAAAAAATAAAAPAAAAAALLDGEQPAGCPSRSTRGSPRCRSTTSRRTGGCASSARPRRRSSSARRCPYTSKTYKVTKRAPEAQPAQAVPQEEAPGRDEDDHHDHGARLHSASGSRTRSAAARCRSGPSARASSPTASRARARELARMIEVSGRAPLPDGSGALSSLTDLAEYWHAGYGRPTMRRLLSALLLAGLALAAWPPPRRPPRRARSTSTTSRRRRSFMDTDAADGPLRRPGRHLRADPRRAAAARSSTSDATSPSRVRARRTSSPSTTSLHRCPARTTPTDRRRSPSPRRSTRASIRAGQMDGGTVRLDGVRRHDRRVHELPDRRRRRSRRSTSPPPASPASGSSSPAPRRCGTT